jgi:hypothetical protein
MGWREFIAGRGGWGAAETNKIHGLADAKGRPIAFHLTPGEAADCKAKAYEKLIDQPHQAPPSGRVARRQAHS